MMDNVMVLLLVLVSFYIGYVISKGIDNNHRELFQGFLDETLKLQGEIDYWKTQYQTLYCLVKDSDEFVDVEYDCQGNIKSIILKEKKG